MSKYVKLFYDLRNDLANEVTGLESRLFQPLIPRKIQGVFQLRKALTPGAVVWCHLTQRLACAHACGPTATCFLTVGSGAGPLGSTCGFYPFITVGPRARH